VQLYAQRMSEVIAMPDRESPRGRVAAEVRAALARARVSGNRLSTLLGQSQPYWSRRLTGKVAFDVDDLSAIADLLGVHVTSFFAVTAGAPRPTGPGGAGWAPSESNREPADSTSAQVTDVLSATIVQGPWPGSGQPADADDELAAVAL
jgi:transcriptional regulator with XRE-family HTH domain